MSQNLEHSKAKQEWLANKINKLKKNKSSFEIVPQARPDSLPLSFSQKRLWFLEQWEPGSAAYNLPYAWRLQGSLNIHALTQSLNQMVERHESLRTTFSTCEGYPEQIITPTLLLTMPAIDLSNQKEGMPEVEREHLIQKEASQGFDLQTGPLLRAKLLRLGSEDHVLLMTFHHIITDGWSMRLFWKEFSTLYNAQVAAQISQLPPLPLQFADFAIWQQQWLQGEKLENQVQYWRSQLSSFPYQIEFPTDFSRPPQQTYKGNSLSFKVSSSVAQSLQGLCQDQGVTLFMALMAAFQVLLFRYSGQRNILVGTPIAGRSHSELEGIIGFFINTLVLGMKFKGNPTFQEVLMQMRETCLDAYSHQDLPFEKLVEILQPERDPSRHPLFQVLFQFNHLGKKDEFTLSNLKVKNIPRSHNLAKFDLSLALASDSETLKGNFSFNTDLFESSTISRMATNFQTLLEGLIDNPTRPIGHIPLLSKIEQQQLLVEWHESRGPHPTTKNVHEMFAEQVALTPEAIALVSEEQHVTYHELNLRAGRLAHFLRSQGVCLESRIGVCLDRGLDLIISLLSVLKAGGAYVPFDPTTPSERLSFMMKNARISTVITSVPYKQQVQSCLDNIESMDLQKGILIELDQVWKLSVPEYSDCHLPIVDTENLAYVMYTSGSTGNPKGVEIPHRSIVRLVNNPRYLNLPQDAIFLQLASPAFDAATFEIWTCLVNGGTLILGPPELPSLNRLEEFLHKFQITILWLTSGLFHQLVDWDIQAFNSVKRLIAGGDVLSPRHVRQVVKELPTCQIINGYGPTENTTFTCCFSPPPGTDFENSIPIGKPIDQTHVYVLDSQQHLLPMGIPGELCIGGLGLARGYHRQPSLTAEHFIPHPYSDNGTTGDRVYRSGDIVRFKNDGNLEFLGRRDHQVKIRGYRIECGEIETTLSRHPSVKETLVLPRKDHLQNNRLIAYIVPKNATSLESDFRHFLSQTLPSFMIPTGFIFLKTFPLTSNGKIDRNNLPSESQQVPIDRDSFVAPKNSLECQLTDIWETVLGHKPISITDNFFNLGGESLLAVRLCSEIERALQRKIPVTLIFHEQTIQRLAIKLAQGGKETPSSLMVTIQAKGTTPPIFCLCFGNTFRPYLKHYPNQPLYMFFNQGYDGKPALKTTVKEIAKSYIKDLRTVQSEGPYYLAGYSFGGMVALEMAQQLRSQGETLDLLVLLEPTSPPSRDKLPTKNFTVSKLLATTTANKPRINIPFLSIISVFLKNVFAALQWRLKALPNWGNDLFHKFTCKLFFLMNHPLHQTFRRPYVSRVVRQAVKQYRPEEYSGDIVVFQTGTYKKSSWGNIVRGKIEIESFPGEHLEMVKEPHAERILHALMKQVKKAQEKYR